MKEDGTLQQMINRTQCSKETNAKLEKKRIKWGKKWEGTVEQEIWVEINNTEDFWKNISKPTNVEAY